MDQKQKEGESNKKDREHDRKREIEKRGRDREREGKREGERKNKRVRSFVVFMRRFRGARRVAIRGMLSGGDIILLRACPREDEVVTSWYCQSLLLTT